MEEKAILFTHPNLFSSGISRHFHTIGCAAGGWRVVDENGVIDLGDDTKEDGSTTDETSASMDIFMMILRRWIRNRNVNDPFHRFIIHDLLKKTLVCNSNCGITIITVSWICSFFLLLWSDYAQNTYKLEFSSDFISWIAFFQHQIRTSEGAGSEVSNYLRKTAWYRTTVIAWWLDSREKLRRKITHERSDEPTSCFIRK